MSSDRSRLENSGRDGAYRKNQKKSVFFLIILAIILVLTVLFSMWAGSYDTPLKELILGIFGQASDNKINVVVRNVRLPRICTAAIAGAGLGVTGCILQAILNNPLASSSTLGVSQGAGFGQIRVGQVLREALHDLVLALPDVVPAALGVAVRSFCNYYFRCGKRCKRKFYYSCLCLCRKHGSCYCNLWIVSFLPDFSGVYGTCRCGNQLHVYRSYYPSSVFCR